MTDWTAQAREVYGRMGRAEATFPPGQAEIDIDILAAALERTAAQERDRCIEVMFRVCDNGQISWNTVQEIAAAIRSDGHAS